MCLCLDYVYFFNFDLFLCILQRGCCAFGDFGSNSDKNSIEAFKSMSQVVIKASNDVVHCEDLQALEGLVTTLFILFSVAPQIVLLQFCLR